MKYFYKKTELSTLKVKELNNIIKENGFCGYSRLSKNEKRQTLIFDLNNKIREDLNIGMPEQIRLYNDKITKNIITNIVMEKGISDIIISMKNELDNIENYICYQPC